MYTEGQYYQLQWGHSCGPWFKGGGFTGIKQYLIRGGPGWYEAAAAWDILAPQILREWIHLEPRDDRGGPGTRPYAWWLFDAPELRRCINGVHPFENEARRAHVAQLEAEHPAMRGTHNKTYFGVPSLLGPGKGYDDFVCEFEQEYQLLDRHNLWLEGELAMAVPRLAAEIAAMRATFASAADKPTSHQLEQLRVFDADLVRLAAKLEALQ